MSAASAGPGRGAVAGAAAPRPPQARRPARWQPGALAILSVCFCASALLRAGEVVAALPAAGSAALAEAGADPAHGAPAPEAGAPEAGAPGGDLALTAAAELRQRAADLAAREARVADRERLLAEMEARIEERLAELEAAREALSRTAALVDGAAERDVARLAEMYQQMKPKQAAQIFDTMEPGFAAGFLAQMRSDSAAAILANMDAEKAYAVTLLMAGRNMVPEPAE